MENWIYRACKTKIDEARKAYDELSEHLISLVTNYNVLTTTEAKYAELKVAADKLKADTVCQSKLIEVLSWTIKDGRVISLIHKYLNAGVISKGIFEKTEVGMP